MPTGPLAKRTSQTSARRKARRCRRWWNASPMKQVPRMCSALMAFADEPKPQVPRLRIRHTACDRGLRVAMVSGDNLRGGTRHGASSRLRGPRKSSADVLPEDKAAQVSGLAARRPCGGNGR
jgi:cation transport ATPase